MGKLIVSEFVSLNGVMEAPGGEHGYEHTGWVFAAGDDEGQGKFKFEETHDSDCLLLGRKTYEGFAAAWPERGGEFADMFNEMPKYVVSSTLTEPLEWNNSHLLEGDAIEAVRKLKDELDGVIAVHGSRTLVQSLIENDLVDEYRIMTFPVILGANGKRWFDESFPGKLELKLVDSQVFGNGVVVHTYHRA